MKKLCVSRMILNAFLVIALALSFSWTPVCAKRKQPAADPAVVKNADHPGGVGMEINQDTRTGNFVVRKVLPGTPAEKSKILEGDRILSIDGAPVDGLHMEEVVEKFRGNVGTKLKLSLQRDEKKRTVTLTRKVIDPSGKKPRIKEHDTDGGGY